MSSYFTRYKLFLLTSIFSISYLFAGEGLVKPVSPNPSKEATELLQYLYSISGKYTLSGQHCQPLYGSTRLSLVHRYTHHYPALFGQDFGFSYPGYLDGINYRQRVVDEAILRYSDGFIITIMWHAVPPTEDEPVTFRKSIQGEISDEAWLELITPGTEINERWKSQVDVIAWFLKQLRDAGVPILWRPYHEMNGGWFWWGKKKGDNGYKKLWRMMFDRFTNFHKLNNLLWVYNTSGMGSTVDSFAEYYPGNDVVDILATDIYSKNFNEDNYYKLTELAGNKLIALGEVGNLPGVEVLEKQPRWVWFMHWGDPERLLQNSDEFNKIFSSEKVITLDELPWVKISEPRIHYPLIR